MTTIKRSLRSYLSGVAAAFAPPPEPVDHHRDELLASLRVDLEEEQDAADKELNDELNSEERVAHRRTMLSVIEYRRNIREDTITNHLKKIDSCSTGTIEMIHAAFHGTGNLTEFITYEANSEASVRSITAFPDSGTATIKANIIVDEVRRVTEIDDLSLLVPGSDEHTLVTALINVTRGISQQRQDNHFRQYEKGVPASNAEANNVSKWIKEERNRIKMTRVLAHVVMNNLDRVDDIIAYFEDRDGDVVTFDLGHLTLHLENASPSLSGGVL